MTKFGRKIPHYSEVFKKSVVKEVLEGSSSAYQVGQRYGLGRTTVYRWLDRYGAEIYIFDSTQEKELMASPKKEKKTIPKDKQSLRIEELEEALRVEQLKREAYEKMIEIAEAQFKIIIGKKFGAKQSKR